MLPLRLSTRISPPIGRSVSAAPTRYTHDILPQSVASGRRSAGQTAYETQVAAVCRTPPAHASGSVTSPQTPPSDRRLLKPATCPPTVCTPPSRSRCSRTRSPPAGTRIGCFAPPPRSASSRIAPPPLSPSTVGSRYRTRECCLSRRQRNPTDRGRRANNCRCPLSPRGWRIARARTRSPPAEIPTRSAPAPRG